MVPANKTVAQYSPGEEGSNCILARMARGNETNPRKRPESDPNLRERKYKWVKKKKTEFYPMRT
jgi:hypothetical protein